MSFQFVIQPAENCVLLSLEGRIVSEEGIAAVLTEFSESISSGKVNWVIDCSKLEYCNSTGLNLFIRVLTKARTVGGECVLSEVQGTVAKLFEISKLNEIFTSYPSKKEAIARFTIHT